MLSLDLWPFNYETDGLVIGPVKQRGSQVSFSPEDFARTRKLFLAETVDVTSSQAIFRGLVYSMLTRSTSYSGQSRILTLFHSQGLDSPDTIAGREDLSQIIKIGASYPNRLASSLGDFAGEWWPSESERFIDGLRADSESGRNGMGSLRKDLCTTCPGFGHKCSSLFLRMCGYLSAVPLDRHGIRFLRDVACKPVHIKYDKRRVRYDNKNKYTRGIRGKDYELYERRFSDFADEFKITPAVLQMLVYVHRTKWDHERHPFMQCAP